MFLRKIANWMSYNQELGSSAELNSVDEYLTSTSETFAEDIQHDGILSTPSLGAETSVLDFFSDLDNSRLDEEERKVTHCGDQKRFQTVFERVSEETEERKDDIFEHNTFESPKKFTNKCSLLANSSVAENKDCDRLNGFKKISAINSEHSNKTYRTTPFCEDTLISQTRASLTKNTNANRRNIFTQTDKVEKRRSITMPKNLCQRSLTPFSVLEKKSKTQPVTRTAANVSPISTSSSDNLEHSSESVVYGTLFVFGCNGVIPAHMIGSMGSKFILRKRFKANGVKEAFSYTKLEDEPTNISPAKHVISYPLSDKRSVVVAFKHDKMTDMFQIGRYEKPPIDFKVSDINESEKSRNGVSRFACRILVRRGEMHEARIYAAAFDSTQGIFLGEGGLTWKQQGKMDGFTTNGVLIMHRNVPGIWREVSVCGFIYPLRTQKTEITKRPRIYEETNVLQDGTLIDLCGVTLVWRTSEGLKKTPNREYLQRLQTTLHKEVPECQLLKSSYLSLPRDPVKWATKKAYVYLSCGHVVGLVLSKVPENLKGWSCPICRVVGPITELAIGAEPGFYMDREFPAYVFKPCGHAASFKTVEYWSSIKVPNHRSIQDCLCPFCGVKLNYIHQFVKLTLPTK